ncbi:hypothetical protein CQ017_11360 [Arthrobacter sp. MYb224]|uniref:hypothetical protein n=1 Tax=unclassified Arthrobacter TaxID=235627 RepID=UPI000CFE118D|nr:MULTISPECIES: hypothetical protein [unclassified Arthrobacter]PQZ98208.1 hypothetical protein CQ017_11360 [Arthrobacter sp. MYb224]PRA02386.1 hypothetical protein CQ019_13030 [Arthrobacter sp. MYb229]PRB50671.1 hypothetical protein CQ013_11795 [Arthrobacter sp. MYb216]
MRSTNKASLFGMLLGFVLGTAAEAIRYNIGDQRSFGEMAFFVISMMIIGAIAPLYKVKSEKRKSNEGSEES